MKAGVVSQSKIAAFVKSHGVGLTGSVACGKSTVLAILKTKGYATVCADELARQLTQPHQIGWQALKQHLPARFFLTDHTLDRPALAQALASSAELKTLLESILHPLIQERFHQVVFTIMQAWQGGDAATTIKSGAQCYADSAYFFYEAALIFETHSAHKFKSILVVKCDEEHQLKRLMRRNGLTKPAAQQLIAAQMSQHDKCLRADYVMDSLGEPWMLNQRVDEYLIWLASQAS